MSFKRLLCPERLRQIPRQFSWIDQRLVREGHIRRAGPEALALYLLLVTVADAQGLSFYGERSICRLLSLDASRLHQSRRELIEAGLIAYDPPLYQVLSLESIDPPVLPRGKLRKPLPAPQPIGQIVSQFLEPSDD